MDRLLIVLILALVSIGCSPAEGESAPAPRAVPDASDGATSEVVDAPTTQRQNGTQTGTENPPAETDAPAESADATAESPAIGSGADPNDDDTNTDADTGEELEVEGPSADAPNLDEGSNDQPAVPAGDPFEVLVDELIVFVETERGLEFTSRPEVVRLDEADFNDAWLEVIDRDVTENAASYEDFTDIYQAMGVLDSNDTLADVWRLFGDAGVLGYYDLDTKQIVLRGDQTTTLTETVLVHELVHALEDQVFGLDRDEYDDRNDEITWAFSALFEGSARVIESRYRATLTAAELDEEIAARNAIPRGVSFNEFTDSFLELQFGRYRYGEDFVQRLWEDGRQAVDAAIIDPPATSEVVLHPELFASESPTQVPAPIPDGQVFESGVWGQAGFAALLADSVGAAAAFELTQGWGGDAYVAWRDGARTCVRLHLSADSPDALDRYAQALDAWAELGPDRSVFFPTAELIRVTSCG